jgi:hypothetical protein
VGIIIIVINYNLMYCFFKQILVHLFHIGYIEAMSNAGEERNVIKFFKDKGDKLVRVKRY